MKRFTALILALLVGASLLTACSSGAGSASSSAASERQGTKEIVYANATDISSMDPRNATGTQTASILNHVFSGLVTTDEKGQVVNDLAESYKNIDDKTWEFKLKSGVTFQDGSKLTSEDVKYTLDTIRDTSKKYKLASDFSFMQVQIIDDLNFRIITDQPFSGFLLRLNYVKIIPKAYVEKVGDEEFAAKPIGSGPYKFVSWSKDEKVVLEANDTYFGGKPTIDKITYKVIPEAASRIAALESGEADIIANVPTSQIERLSSLQNVKVLSNPTTRVMFVGMNLVKDGPLQNEKVRQALNYAVDKQALIKGVLDGNATQIATISTPEYEGYDASVEAYSYDPEKAKQLLTEAGYANGFSLQFSVTSGYLNGQDVAQAIASQLGQVGITCTVQEEDSNQQREKISSGTVADLYLNGIGGPYSNIDLVAKLAFGTGERYSTYSNTEFDTLRKEAAATVDKEKAKVKNSELQKLIREQAPAVFLYQQHGIYAYNTRVSNWLPRVDEMIIVSNANVN